MNCYHCGVILTSENKSIEHIIPNALGGVLKSDSLLCKICNPLLGQLYDAELCKSLSQVSGFLNVKRERGTHPSIKNVKNKSGEIFTLEKGRYPVPVKPEINISLEKNIVSVSARDEKELKHIISKLKKKYLNLDDKGIENKMVRKKYYMDEPIQMSMSVGSSEFMKGILKIALNFYFYKGLDKRYVENRIEDLKSTNDPGVEILRHYYPKEYSNYLENEIAHTIYVHGDPETKLLYAFVEIYSSFAFIINLNKEYDGPKITYTYSYDVILCKAINKNVKFDYNGKLEGDLNLLNEEFISTINKKLNRVFAIGDNRQVDSIISDITSEAMKKTLGQYPEGHQIDENEMKKFIATLSEDIAPFIYHINSKRRFPSAKGK